MSLCLSNRDNPARSFFSLYPWQGLLSHEQELQFQSMKGDEKAAGKILRTSSLFFDGDLKADGASSGAAHGLLARDT